jgi:hypothetical protein
METAMNTEDAMRQAATAADFYMNRAVSGQEVRA